MKYVGLILSLGPVSGISGQAFVGVASHKTKSHMGKRGKFMLGGAVALALLLSSSGGKTKAVLYSRIPYMRSVVVLAPDSGSLWFRSGHLTAPSTTFTNIFVWGMPQTRDLIDQISF